MSFELTDFLNNKYKCKMAAARSILAGYKSRQLI